MGFFGDDRNRLGKRRSKFGQWLDRNNIKQDEFANESKVNRNTISNAASGKSSSAPIKRNRDRIMRTAKKHDPNAKDFWS